MNENTSGLSPEVIEGVFNLARDGQTGPLGEMIDAGVGLNVLNPRGDTLLIVAAYQQQPETVGELLRRGADASVVNAMGQTAISCAVFRGNEAILRLLLEADADPRLGTHSGVAIADQFGLPRMREIIESYPRD
ncbi:MULTISPECIES: ankyrin repeat domain-containing protein [unclassified Cryobacterium]|uniref:ankyrin repeat domain-containing protein n=1 Tax=unclassified Cryobacterium TaxID=2649013 RepID=UPI0018E097B6|nr:MULTISPECIES: ankyrin repeat domain-containing protein [unclassified Cryobacterium]